MELLEATIKIFLALIILLWMLAPRDGGRKGE